MSTAQDRLVLAAWMVAESAWAFAVLGLVGIAFGLDASPLNWLAVVAVMVTSGVVARAIASIIMPTPVAYGLQMALGALVVYLTVGSQAPDGAGGLDAFWIGHLFSGDASAQFAFRTVIGAFMGAILWFRGGRVVTSTHPVEGLATSFKVGVLAMAAAAVVDTFHPADIHVYPALFVFMASALAGLATGRLFPASGPDVRQQPWPRVIGGVVAAFLAIGLLVAVVQNAVLPLASTGVNYTATWLANTVIKGILLVIIAPVAYLAGLLLQALQWLVRGRQGQPVEPMGQSVTALDFLEDLRRNAEGAGGTPLFLKVLAWALVALVIAGVLVFLAQAFRRRVRYRSPYRPGARESVRDQADPLYDALRLLYDLLPQRWRKGRGGPALRLPAGHPGIVEAFRVYYRLLALAAARGVERHPFETPAEFQQRLEPLFPAPVVALATQVFCRACYGHVPATDAEIEEMNAGLGGVSPASVPTP